MSILYTSSAGRLLSETRHLLVTLRGKGSEALFSTVALAFSRDGMEWPVGLSAYYRLTRRCLADLNDIDHSGIQRFTGAIESVSAICNPELYSNNSRSFADQYFSEIILERLQNADDVLILKSKKDGFDQDHANITLAGISDILDQLSKEQPSETRTFIELKLGELRMVLERYVLFGPEGVADVVSGLIGGIAIRKSPAKDMSPSEHDIVSKVYGIAKAALGVVVWSKETFEALTWAAEKSQLILGGQ